MYAVFGDHIGRTVEAYVDDIVVKTRNADDLVSDLRIAFGCLRANGVKLNPKKCVFGVPRGMLLVYIVSQRGIEANPEKVAALERMGPIRDLKGVQRVLGCLAALSRFISRLGEKGLPLYRLLKKHERFSWTVETQVVLHKQKASLTHAPILTPSQDSEPMYLYVAAAPEKARPQRMTIAATAGIKWSGPLPSKEDPQAARAPGSNKTDPRRVRIPTSGLEARSK
jgi:hypothetical protein